MAQKYKNIPVKPATYAHVKVIADANNRGLGDQVKTWADRELPECSHKKLPVSIETFPGEDYLPGKSLHKNGYYCPTCKRVYEQLSDVVCDGGEGP